MPEMRAAFTKLVAQVSQLVEPFLLRVYPVNPVNPDILSRGFIKLKVLQTLPPVRKGRMQACIFIAIVIPLLIQIAYLFTFFKMEDR